VNSTGAGAQADPLNPAQPVGDHQIPPAGSPQLPEYSQPTEPALASPVPGISRIGKVFGTVVAPTTLLTALLYYFGWAHAYYFFGYFGVNSTLLGFATTDYLMRSVDALFIPMTVAAIAVLAALRIDSAVRGSLIGRSGDSVRRILTAGLTAGALALVAAGGICTFAYRTALNQYAAAAPLCFALGILLLAYAMHVRRHFAAAEHKRLTIGARPWASAVEWAVVFVLVGISLFAAATDYAASVGTARAQHFAAYLWAQPDVLVYSDKDLSLDARGVSEVRCGDQVAAYRFRYQGLKLVLQSGGLYLFLPEQWRKATGAAILIPQSSSLRLEFYSASFHADSRPSTC